MSIVLFYFGKDLLGVLTTKDLEKWYILRVTWDGGQVELSLLPYSTGYVTAVVCLILPPYLVLVTVNVATATNTVKFSVCLRATPSHR